MSVPPTPSTTTSTPSIWERLDLNNLPCNLCSFNTATVIFIPVLVVFGLIQNGFALEVLQSPFLTDLPSQPVIKALLTLQTALLITGPLYMWLTFVFGPLLKVTEVCPCFFLAWFHDFLIVSTSWLLVTWVIERVVSIGKPKQTWVFWRMRFLEVSIILVGVALIVTLVGGIFNGCLSGAYRDPGFSLDVCLPWLDMERIIVFYVWRQLLAILFSLAPCITLLVFSISLVSSVYYLNFKMKRLLMNPNHYQLHLAMVRNTAQIKFVYTLVCACPIFLLTCIPIGLSLYSLWPDGSIQIFSTGVRHYGRVFHIPGVDHGIRIDYGGVKVEDYPDPFQQSANSTSMSNDGMRQNDFERFLKMTQTDMRRLKSTNDSDDKNVNIRRTDRSSFKGENRENDFNVGLAVEKTGAIGSNAVDNNVDEGVSNSGDYDDKENISNRLKVKVGDDRNNELLSRIIRRRSGLDVISSDGHDNLLPGELKKNDVGVTDPELPTSTDTFTVNVDDRNDSRIDQPGSAGVQNGRDNDVGDGDMDYNVRKVKNGTRLHTLGKYDSTESWPFQNMNTICALWLLYYCFSVAVVPLLLITEPLFRHEWLHTWSQLKMSICCLCIVCCSRKRRHRGSTHVHTEILPNNPPVTGDGIPSNNSNPKTFVVNGQGEFSELGEDNYGRNYSSSV